MDTTKKLKKQLFLQKNTASGPVIEPITSATKLKLGDKIKVRLVGTDPKTGKFKLSLKALLPKPEGYVERPEREDRPDRGDRPQRNDRGGNDRGDRKPRPQGDRPSAPRANGNEEGGPRADRAPRENFSKPEDARPPQFGDSEEL